MAPIRFALLWSVLVTPVVHAASLCSGGDCSSQFKEFERLCRARGGTPIHNPSGGGYCSMTGAGQAASGPNAATTGFEMGRGLAEWLMAPDTDAIAARQRRENMMQALENERQDALRRQDTARAAGLAAVQERLMASGLGLKGTAGNDGGLQLKLGSGDSDTPPAAYGLPGRHVFRNDIFTPKAPPTPTETIATQLTLKLGDRATESLRDAPAPEAASATPAASGKVENPNTPPDVKELTRLFDQLTPEQQQSLLARLTGSAGPVTLPTGATPPATVATNPQLSLKLESERRSADTVRAAAADPGISPEALKSGAEQQFNRSAGLALRDLEPMRPNRAAGTRTPATTPAVTSNQRARTAAASANSAVVAALPPAIPSTGRIQPPQPADLQFLFSDVLKSLPSRAADDDRDLLEIFQAGGAAPGEIARKRSQAADMVVLGVTAMPDDPLLGGFRTGSSQRRALVGHFAPALAQRYEEDPRLAGQVDALIDIRVADVRRWLADANMAAWEASLDPTMKLMQRYTPEGQRPDVATLVRNPSFMAERDRIAQAILDARRANVREAQVRLKDQLAAGFAALRR